MKFWEWDWLYSSDFDQVKKSLQWKSFLKEIDEDFRLMMLSPRYADVKQIHRMFDVLLRNWNNLYQNIPETMTGFDFHKMRLNSEKTQGHLSIEERLDFLREFMMPLLKLRYNDGLCIKEFIFDHLHLSHVGIEPLLISKGFLLLKNGNTHATLAFRYYYNGLIDEHNRLYLTTEKVCEYEYSISNSFLNMKRNLQEKFRDWGPVYLIESDIELPLWHSIRPVAKSKLAKYISSL
jgi:hypothetical protein